MFENKVVIKNREKGLRIKGFPFLLSPFPCLAPALLHNFVLIFAGVYCEWQEFIYALQFFYKQRTALHMPRVVIADIQDSSSVHLIYFR